MTREEAEEPVRTLEEKGEAAAFDYLKQFHEPGEGILVSTRENPWKEDEWVMLYNFDVPYIGLVVKILMP